MPFTVKRCLWTLDLIFTRIFCGAIAERLPEKSSKEQLEGSHHGASWLIMASFCTVSAQCSAPRSQGLISYLNLYWSGDQRGETAVGVPLCAPWKDKDFMLFPIWYLFLAQPPHSSPRLPAASTPTRLALSAFLRGARLSTYLTV